MTVQPTRDQLRALADAATPGPWEAHMDSMESALCLSAGSARPDEHGDCPGSYYTSDRIIEHDTYDLDIDLDEDDPWDTPEGRNVAFIAAARTALPRLLDQLDAAEQRIRDLTQEVRDERAAARDQMEQVRIRDARIKAVQDVLDEHEEHFRAFWAANGKPDAAAPGISVAAIRRALEG